MPKSTFANVERVEGTEGEAIEPEGGNVFQELGPSKIKIGWMLHESAGESVS